MKEGHGEKEYDIPSHIYTCPGEENYIALANSMSS